MSTQKKPVQRILRVGLFQNKNCIEERLIHTRKAVTIGQDLKKNTFVVPASKLPRTYQLFDVKDGEYVLNFTKDMTGRVSVGDSKPLELEELVKMNKAQKSGDGYALKITEKTYGRVAFENGGEEVAILFQFVKPPPPRTPPVLPASMRGGLLFALVGATTLLITTFISAFLQVGFVAFVLAKDWPQPKDIDYVMPDRFVSIMVDEKPEPIEAEPIETEEGDGPGEEVEDDGPSEPAPKADDEPKAAPKTAEERAAADAERKRRLAEEVQNKTILGQIGALSSEGGSLIDSLSEGAGRTSMEEAFANSAGIATNVAGAEQSGLRTSGSSDADGKGSAVGMGELKGLAGASKAEKGVDTGKQAEKKVKVKLNLKTPEKMVGGKLDSNSVSDVIRRRQAAIQRCYEREIKNNPSASGKVVVSFTIGTIGRVTSAKAVEDSVGGGVGTCVAGVVKGFRFPRPEGGEVIVNKTFVFEVAQ